jgi:hypothetical protein
MFRGKRLAVIPILLAVLAAPAGCGGDEAAEPGVATAGRGPSAGAGSHAAETDDAKFKECLQRNGVDVKAFERGENTTAGLPELVRKCREFLPDGGELAPLAPEEIAKIQAYAKCMRANGVPDFPDPTAAGDFGPGWDGTKVLATAAGEKANATCSKELMSAGR